jgi:hypothetical protein
MPIWAPYRIFYSGSEWQAIRQRELERAGYRCEDCGVSALLLSVGSIDVFRKLHVSHENHDPWRKRAKLRVRCTPCHNTHDAAHKRDAHYRYAEAAGQTSLFSTYTWLPAWVVKRLKRGRPAG